MTKHEAKLEGMTAAWLLPIVATIVAAASGGIVAEVIPDPQKALITVIVSYVLWGTGVPTAMVVLSVYFLRLTTCHLPKREVVVSVFLPLGPLGQGSFAVLQLGKVAHKIFAQTDTLPVVGGRVAGEILYVGGFYLAIIMWGFGLVWLFFALATIYTTHRFPFNIGWWGFTFPLGVYTVSTTTLGSDLPSAFFRVLGTMFSVAVTLLWLIVALGTLHRAYTGVIFVAPCLKEVEAIEEKDVVITREC
jgi:tellurite resistance protein TehA-like permease